VRREQQRQEREEAEAHGDRNRDAHSRLVAVRLARCAVAPRLGIR
jgi:hypothetical protein